MLAVPRIQDRLSLFPPASGRLEFWSLVLAAKVRSTDRARIGSTLVIGFKCSRVHPDTLSLSEQPAYT